MLSASPPRLARLGRLAKLAPFLHESTTWKYIQAGRTTQDVKEIEGGRNDVRTGCAWTYIRGIE